MKTRANRLSILLIAIAAINAGCHRADNDTSEQKNSGNLERAESYRQQGQYRAAIIEARNAMQKNPDDSAAKLELASILNELGQGKATSKLLENATDNPSKEEALAIAQAYALQHKYRTVIDYLDAHEKRLGLAENIEANLIKARAYLHLRNFDAASSLLARLDDKNASVALEKQRLLWLQGETSASQTALAQLLEQHPTNVNILSEAALQAEQQGRLSDAEDLLSKALMNLPQTDIVSPQKAEILQRLISTLTKLGRSNEALIYAKTLADSNPTGALLQDKFKQGLELFQAGKLDEAEPLLKEVYGESENEMAGMLLGMIRYAKKDFRGAAEYLNSNIDPETAPETALTTLAATQLHLAQPQKILQLLGENERKNLKTPELKMLVGIALLQTGSKIEGERLVKSAQAEQPNNPTLSAMLARHYLTSNQPEAAIAILEPAVVKQTQSYLSRLLIDAYNANGNFDKALSLARQVADSAPATAENAWVLGHTALQQKKLDIAETALKKSLSLQTGYLPAELDLGRLYLARKQSAEAESTYRAILKRESQRLDAAKGLLFALLQRGMSPQAAEAELMAAAKPDNARLALSEYYLQTQKLSDAEKQLSAVSGDNTSVQAKNLTLQLALFRAAKAIEDGDVDNARNVIANALQAYPNSSELLTFLARIELKNNNLDAAKKIAAQLTQTSQPPAHVLELQGDIAMQEKNVAAAQYYRAAWQQRQNDGIASKLYRSLANNPREARQFVDEWLQRLPNSANVYFLRGLNKQQANDDKGAIADYETALTKNPKDARALNNLAWLYSKAGDRRALPTAEQAFNLQPENPATLDTYGWILVQSGEVKRGTELLQQALKLAPGSEEIQQHLNEAAKRKQPSN